MSNLEKDNEEVMPESLKLDFSHTLNFDWVLYPYDIQVNIAYTKMLNHIGLINKDETVKICDTFEKIKLDIEDGKFPFKSNQPDIQAAIQDALQNSLGDLAGKITIGRSKLDLTSTDLRMWTKDQIKLTQKNIKALQKSILKQAKEHLRTFMPIYTDMQPTQTVTLSHQLLAYMEMLQRDVERLTNLSRQIDVLPLGSGYGAGTTLPIDRIFLANLLSFSKVSNNSIDAVGDRDFLLEFLYSMTMISQHLSRICSDLVLWASEGYGFIYLPEEFTEETTQTSILRRSIVPELIRGKTGKVFGALYAALVAVKGLPSHFSRDLQEDKEAAIEANDIIQTSLTIMSRLFLQSKFSEENLHLATKLHLWESHALVEYLIKNGKTNSEATATIKKVLDFAVSKKCRLNELQYKELQEVYSGFGPEVMQLLTPKGVVQTYASIGSSNIERNKQEIEDWDSKI